MSVSAAQFRAALGHWASGVAVVTSAAGGRVHGMTVTAFASASLEPPLVLVCADRSSRTLEVIEAGGVFAVNVLGAAQRALAERFASKADEDRRFEGLRWSPGVTGAPRIEGSVAALDCRVVAAHGAGDHVIVVGRVEDAQVHGGEPLLYGDGAYRELAGAGRA